MIDESNYRLQQLSGADSHVKSLDSRISQTPVTDVVWSGARGVSECTPQDPGRIALLKRYGQTSVKYDRTGEPDFRPFEETHTLIHNMSGDRQRNFSSANQKLLGTQWAKSKGLKTVTDCQRYMKEHNLTWHECSDGVTMRLVNSDINGGFGHSGGVAELDAMGTEAKFDGDLLRVAGKSTAELRITARKTGVAIQDGASRLTEDWDTARKVAGEISESAIQAGKSAALVTLTVSGINNLVAVAQGGKDLDTALYDIATDSTATFVSAAGADLTRKALSFVVEQSQSEILAGLSATAIPSAEIAAAVMVASSVKRYMDGDISAEDCAVEILLNGVGTLSYQLGMMAGGPVGAAIASIVTTQIANTIVEYRQEKKAQKRHDVEIGWVLSAAQSETKRQQTILRQYFRTELDRWDRQIATGFAQIDKATRMGDSNGVAEGLDVILSLIGSQVRFRDTSQFKSVFFNPDAKPIIM